MEVFISYELSTVDSKNGSFHKFAVDSKNGIKVTVDTARMETYLILAF